MTDAPSYLDPEPFPQPLQAPPASGRVLVIAPHPDDELIGPGGTVLLHRAAGDPVSIVVLTDGSSGDGGEQHGGRLVELREQESRQCAERLGAVSIEFLRFPDGARARAEDLAVVVPRLAEAIERSGAEVVYTPHLGENHADHYVTAVATCHAVRAVDRDVALFGYEVWTALVADVVVDITAQMETKLAIARVFETQTAHTDILHFFGGLNAYRGVFLPAGARYGEAFQRLDPATVP